MAKKKQIVYIYKESNNFCILVKKYKIQNITGITNLVFHSNKMKNNKKQNEKIKLTMNHTKRLKRRTQRKKEVREKERRKKNVKSN